MLLTRVLCRTLVPHGCCVSKLCSDVSAAILDGGRGQRFGGTDKAWLRVNGESIVSHQLRVLRKRCADIAMVVGQTGDVRDLPVQALSDRVGGLGPIDGIAAALAWAKTPWVLVTACDMPGLRLDVLDLLLRERRKDADIIAAVAHRFPQPLFALYRTRLLPILDRRLTACRLTTRELLDGSDPDYTVILIDENDVRSVDPTLETFANLNRPEDLAEYS